MAVIKYISFVSYSDELDEKLNELGAHGWRLHTCEPKPGYEGRNTPVLVVMDMMVDESEVPYADGGDPNSAGIPMKG